VASASSKVVTIVKAPATKTATVRSTDKVDLLFVINSVKKAELDKDDLEIFKCYK
jgi:hypothetical protein